MLKKTALRDKNVGSGPGGPVVYFWNHGKGWALVKKNSHDGIATEKWLIFFLVFSMKQWKAIQDTSTRLLGTMILAIFHIVNITVSCLQKNSYTFFFVFPIRFFVVEDHILHATQGLVTRPFTDELWNMALSKIIAVLRTHSVGNHTQTCLQAEFVVLLILLTPCWHLKFQIHYPTITKQCLTLTLPLWH